MEQIWITLALYLIGVLAGAYLGHLITRQHYERRIKEAITLSSARNAECRQLLDILKVQVNVLKGQLAKYHTKRGANGRFTKK